PSPGPIGRVVIEPPWSGVAEAGAARYVRLSLDGIVGDYWPGWPSVLMTESYHYAPGYGGAGGPGVTGPRLRRRRPLPAPLAASGRLRLACIDLEAAACADRAAVEMSVPALRFTATAAAAPLPDGHRLAIIEVTEPAP